MSLAIHIGHVKVYENSRTSRGDVEVLCHSEETETLRTVACSQQLQASSDLINHALRPWPNT